MATAVWKFENKNVSSVRFKYVSVSSRLVFELSWNKKNWVDKTRPIDIINGYANAQDSLSGGQTKASSNQWFLRIVLSRSAWQVVRRQTLAEVRARHACLNGLKCLVSTDQQRFKLARLLDWDVVCNANINCRQIDCCAWQPCMRKTTSEIECSETDIAGPAQAHIVWEKSPNCLLLQAIGN